MRDDLDGEIRGPAPVKSGNELLRARDVEIPAYPDGSGSVPGRPGQRVERLEKDGPKLHVPGTEHAVELQDIIGPLLRGRGFTGGQAPDNGERRLDEIMPRGHLDTPVTSKDGNIGVGGRGSE